MKTKTTIPFFILFLLLSACRASAQEDTLTPLSDSSMLKEKRFLQLTDNNEWDSALYYAKDLQLLSAKEKGEISNGNACSIYQLAETYMAMNNFYQAYFFYKKAVDVFNKLKHIYSTDLYGLALGRTGFMCMRLGLTDEAQPYFEKALVANSAVKNSNVNFVENIQIRMTLAELAVQKGEFSKAENLYTGIDKVLDTLPAGAFTYYVQGAVYGNHATLFNDINYPQKAIEYLEKSLKQEKLAMRLNSGLATEDYIAILLNLAEAYTLTGNTISANKKCAEAEKYIRTKSGMSYANLLKEKAYICQQQKNWQESIDLNIQYKAIADTIAAKMEDYDATIVNMAAVYTHAKKYAVADTIIREEIARLHKLGYNFSYVMQQAFITMCANLIQTKKYSEATDSLLMVCGLTYDNMQRNFLGMSETEKMQYEKGLDKIFDLLYVCVYKNAAISQHTMSAIYTAELQRNGLTLNSQILLLNNLRSSHDTGLLKIANEWKNDKELLCKQYSLPGNERFLSVDSLEEICEKLEKQLSAKAAIFKNNNEADKAIANIKKQKNAYANIDFIQFNYNAQNIGEDNILYAAFVVSPADGALHFVHLCSSAALQKIMKDTDGKTISETQLTAKLYGSNNAGSSLLYQLVWKPLTPYLNGVKTINYSTSGMLNNIAFQAVYNGKNYLTNQYAFHRFFNLKEAAYKAEQYEAPEAISIWGNMNYNKAVYAGNPSNNNEKADSNTAIAAASAQQVAVFKNVSAEPLYAFSTNEPAQLKKIFNSNHIPVSSYESSAASEDYFKQQSAFFTGVLHISTHGFYTPFSNKKTTSLQPGNYISGIENPLFRCGLAFAGVNNYWVKGAVKNNHDDGILTGYEAAQLDLHNVQLVTLSACETGLGDVTDNEGNIGLQRAFKLAGAHTLLVSLWQVPAKQTSELLALFYANWLQGITMSEALRKAESRMAKRYPPYYWAGFILEE